MSNYDFHLMIKDETGEDLLETKARVPEHVYKEVMKQFGFYLDEPKPMRALPIPAYKRVKCKFRDSCIEDSEKCSECRNNEAQSYFVEK